MTDLQRAAIGAREAFALLSEALTEPSPDTVQALAIIGQALDDIEAGDIPQARPDDWPGRKFWPNYPHWDKWAWTIRTLAGACGTAARCTQKYQYLRVTIDTNGPTPASLWRALGEIGDMIELASDYEE